MRFAAFFLVLPAFLCAAKYQGQDVDGTAYFAFVRSLQTGKYFPATVVFRHDHASVRLKSGKKLELTLDQPDVNDPEEVIAVDPSGRSWALSVDGLNEPSGRSETSLVESNVRRS